MKVYFLQLSLQTLHVVQSVSISWAA